MDDGRKYYTFIWKIKNFSFSYNHKGGLKSPCFYVNALYKSRWSLRLSYTSNYMNFGLQKQVSKYPCDPDKLEIDYELAFLSGDGSVILSEIFLNQAYIENHTDIDSVLRVKQNDVFVNRKQLFIPDNTLNIRCRIRSSQEFMPEIARCRCVETNIDTKFALNFGAIKNFSSLETSSRNTLTVRYEEKPFCIRWMSLSISDDAKLAIEIQPISNLSHVTYMVQIFILDIYNNKVECGLGEMCDRQPFSIPLTFSRKHLLENKELYLPDDVMTLKCEVFFANGFYYTCISPTVINDITLDYDCGDVQMATNIARNANISSDDRHPKSLIPLIDGANATNLNLSIGQRGQTLKTLNDDLVSTFCEGILCDTILKTATETFQAHAVVLSARSSVFKSMFVPEMRGKTNKCVNIKDLNADTVRKMLLFMYSDALDELDYNSAKSLYFAAHKYNIMSLRHKCSTFLKQNVRISNCCAVLLLADQYQDLDLKKSVQNFISENDELVFSSDEWKYLEENQPKLTTEALRVAYSSLKNRKT